MMFRSPNYRNMGIVTVIAAYNKGKETTERAVRDARAFCDHVVVVDDGSTDDTSVAVFPEGVTLLRHIVNRGQGAALQTGMDYALAYCGANVIVHFDADGQMQGEDIPSLVAPILAGEVDVVLGSRFLEKKVVGIPFIRRVMLRLGTWFTIFLSGIRVTDTHNGFRALSKHAAQEIRITLDRMAHASEILDLVKTKRLRYTERPVKILYSEDSLARGQSTSHAMLTVKDILKKKFLG